VSRTTLPWERRLEQYLGLLEEGRLLPHIVVLTLLVSVSAVLIAGRFRGDVERTVIYRTGETQRYHVRKVSEIPKELEKDEAEKEAAEDTLSPDDIRRRYVQYVVSRIERVKVYPLEAQKRGHEGVVVVRLLMTKDGDVKKVGILQPARYQALTDAAIVSIRRALPFQPFPSNLPDETLTLRVEIRFLLR